MCGGVGRERERENGARMGDLAGCILSVLWETGKKHFSCSCTCNCQVPNNHIPYLKGRFLEFQRYHNFANLKRKIE